MAAAMSMVYVFTTPILEDGENATVDKLRRRNKWDNDDYVCRCLILKGMSDPLFDIYQNVESGKELWDSLEAKYMAEDASSKKFLVSCIINKLPLSWKDFKHTLKHKKELTLVELGSHLRVEESLRVQDSDKPKGNNVSDWTWLNIVNDIGKSAFMSTFKLNDSIIWHAKLCHVHFKRMQDMSKDGLIPAFDMETGKTELRVLGAVVRLPDLKIKTLGERGIECIFDGYAEHSKAFRFSSVSRLSLRIPNETEYIGGLVVPEEVTEEKEAINDEMYSIMGNNTWVLADRPLVCKQYFVTFIDDAFRAVVRLSDLKLKTLGEKGIECIFVGYAEHSKAFRPSLRIPNGTEDIGGSLVPKEVTEEVVQQPEPKLRKGKRDRTPKNFGPEFQLYLIEGTRDEYHKTVDCYGINSQSDYSSDGCEDTFLNGELDEEVPKQWHQKFDEVVLSNGYLLNQADKYVYRKFDKTGKGVIICLYVDDMLIFGTDQVQVNLTKEFLSSRFSMKDMGEADVILGIRIKHESNGIAISQSYYIEKVLKKFKYFDCTPVSTPIDTSEKLMPNNGQVVSTLEYSRVIGCLMYVMTCTRPDIAFVVGKLSRSATLKTIRLPMAGYPFLVEVQFLGHPINKLASLVSTMES
ncbi:zinc finger, CCHC-type containing protein [Tanacetum coccineum]